jgi:hypothetical protein
MNLEELEALAYAIAISLDFGLDSSSGKVLILSAKC